MNLLGIDTSNYTTSVAVYSTEDKKIIQEKKLLPVKAGERGLRQSDAVFHHTVQLPERFEALWQHADLQNIAIDAIGASAFPRRMENSYMPCFLVGSGMAKSMSFALHIPYFEFSHQEGHVAAALYSAHQLSLLQAPFLAFHLSGGTTDALLVEPDAQHILNVTLLKSSLDLKAGQLIDRVGVLLGLQFPCGPAMEKLAFQSNKEFSVRPTVKDGNCCLSGIENQCQKLLRENEAPENIAKFCLMNVIVAVDHMLQSICHSHPNLPIVFSGGVASNAQLQAYFKAKYNTVYFAEPIFSADNAAGIAVLTALMKERTGL